MRRLLFILPVFILMSCAAARNDMSGEQEVNDQNAIKSAVESRRFIIKLDRMYLISGMVDLKPRSNYIIVDGKKAIINTAYLGRQYDIRPIAGINMRGVAVDYELTNKVNKGRYEIKMKVGNGATTFQVYIDIASSGSCSASLSGIRIDNVRYSGFVVPIPGTDQENQKENKNLV